MRYISLFIVGLLVLACQSKELASDTTNSPSSFSIQTAENPDLQYENLRLYPIHATDEFIETQQPLADWKSLDEAIENKRFRITEKKPFGRFNDNGAVNELTVQNKSDEHIFIMSGDVMQGGKQDRMIAQDLVVPPNTITDVAVFCVEKGRWTAEKDENDKAIYAFKGYYNVASNDLRRTMKETNNQQAVWDKVGEITSEQAVETETGTYTALEVSDDFTHLRENYLRFFKDKFERTDKVVGIAAVSGTQVLGMDIFGHPNLFKSKYESLLHAYITEAINEGGAVTIRTEKIEALQAKAAAATQEKDKNILFKHQNYLVHFADL